MGFLLREKLSRMRAQAGTLAGIPRGFFIQYDYARSVAPVSEPYREFELLCESSPFEQFLDEMSMHVPAFKGFGADAGDPEWGHGMFPPLDGAAAYTAVKKFQPKQIIEIGSGDSTRYLAKAAAPEAKITCIDPQPRRSIETLPVDFIRRVIRNSDADLMDSLDASDILFIDSSHIMLPGMDVDIQFNRFFPRLRPGVVVHVHDIFLPDDYPPHWAGRRWNEQNALAGWLLSGFFEILYPGHYVATRHGDKIDRAFAEFPLATRKNAGSLWLRRR